MLNDSYVLNADVQMLRVCWQSQHMFRSNRVVHLASMTVCFVGQNSEQFAGEIVQYSEKADRHFGHVSGRSRPFAVVLI